MLMATITIMVAAIARLPLDFIMKFGPPAFYGLQDLLIVAVLVYDYRANGRVHRANKWAAALIILSQPLTLAISGTAPWLALADGAKG